MPIVSIDNQPATGSINAAFSPVVIGFRAVTGPPINVTYPAPPVVFTDIYINGTYYRSIHATFPSVLQVESIYNMDIRQACQERLIKLFTPTYGGTAVEVATGDTLKVYAKCRSSSPGANGAVSIEGPAPVQATGTSAAVSGGGTQSNTFYVFPSALQHIDAQSLAAHLEYLKRGTWEAGCYPLSHRPSPTYIAPGQSAHFAAIIGADVNYNSIKMHYRLNAGDSYTVVSSSFTNVTNADARIVYIPVGTSNMAALFPAVNMAAVHDYYVVIGDGADAVATSPVHQLKKCDGVRLHFRSSPGGIDQVNFRRNSVTHSSKGERITRTVPAHPFNISAHRDARAQVEAVRTYSVTCIDYPETAQDWLTELLDSPQVWMEIAARQGQPAALVPVVISDIEHAVAKPTAEAYTYEFTITFTESVTRNNVRI